MRFGVAAREARVMTAVLTLVTVAWAAGARAEPLRAPPPSPMPQGPGITISPGPARDDAGRPRPRPVGTSVIRGLVIDGVTKQPLARATVSVRYDEEARRTDESGAFVVRALPAGRYTVSVRRPGYLPATYPATRSIRAAQGVAVADGEEAAVTIPMYRGAAITGRVVDEFGEPVDRAMVFVQAARGVEGFGMSSDSTDDAGEFRVGRLPAGRYTLSVKADQWASEPSRWATGDAPASRPGYVTTFYPGVVAEEQAGVITLERGQTMSGVEVVVSTVSQTLLAGTVTNAKGGPAQSASIRVHAARAAGATPRRPRGNDVRVMMQNGAFQAWVQPGEYEIFVSSWPSDNQTGAERRLSEFAYARVTVGGEATEVSLTTAPPGAISGRVIFDGQGTPPPLGTRGLSFPIVRGIGDECRAEGSTTFNPDGTFTMSGVWGLCRANLQTGMGGWHVRSIRHGGDDITTGMIDLTKPQEMKNVEVTLTDRPARVTFEVTGDAGPTSEYVALLFSTRKEDWTEYQGVHTFTPATAMVTNSAVANTAVAFRLGPVMTAGDGPGLRVSRGGELSSVRPGDYYAVALDDATYEQARDPEFLEQLIAGATRISVAEGDERRVSLKRQAAPR